MSAQFQGVAGYNQKITELYTLESRSLQRFRDYHMTNTGLLKIRERNIPD